MHNAYNTDLAAHTTHRTTPASDPHQSTLRRMCHLYSAELPHQCLSWLGHFIGGLQAEALVELTNIAPTLMHLAGLLVPVGTRGSSLLPILTGEIPADRH